MGGGGVGGVPLLDGRGLGVQGGRVPTCPRPPVGGAWAGPSLSNEALLFHEKCGALIKLSNGHKTAERRRPLDEFNNGVVLTNRPLRDGEMFEVGRGGGPGGVLGGDLGGFGGPRGGLGGPRGDLGGFGGPKGGPGGDFWRSEGS